MSTLFSQPQFLLVAGGVGVTLFFLVTFAMLISRFYRRCGADEALVRTGAGGTEVKLGGGMLVMPVLHQLMRVSLRSLKLSVERSGKNALVTRDKIKANVTTELYVKVEPLREDVLAAARSFGERNLDEHAISELIEGKLTDALRSVAANQTFMDLHSKRKEFAEHIHAALADELKKNGLMLENVSITALAMVPVKDLDPQDVFDAEGLRAITESVQTNAEKTNQVQREKENAIKTQNVVAKTRALELEQTQAMAEADQSRRVAEYQATQKAETAKVVFLQQQTQELAAYERQRAIETARIEQEKAVAIAQAARGKAEREAQIAAEKSQQAAEIAKQKEIEAAVIDKERAVMTAEIERQKTIEAAQIDKQRAVEAAEIAKQQTIETARIAKQIAVTQSEEEQARAGALKAQADAAREVEEQAIVTVEATAKANRDKDIAVIKAREQAEQARIGADREAYRVKLEAEAQAAVVRAEAQAEADRVRIAAEARAAAAEQEAAAIEVLAKATEKRGSAEAEAKRLLVEAENRLGVKFMLRDVALKALDVMPAVTHELMTPAKAIRDVKVLQLAGMPGMGANGASSDARAQSGAFGMASPLVRTILEAGAAYPLLRELMQFAKVDGADLGDKVRGLLGAVPGELRGVLESDPELGPKVAELARRFGDAAPAASEADAVPAAEAAAGAPSTGDAAAPRTAEPVPTAPESLEDLAPLTARPGAGANGVASSDVR